MVVKNDIRRDAINPGDAINRVSTMHKFHEFL